MQTSHPSECLGPVTPNLLKFAPNCCSLHFWHVEPGHTIHTSKPFSWLWSAFSVILQLLQNFSLKMFFTIRSPNTICWPPHISIPAFPLSLYVYMVYPGSTVSKISSLTRLFYCKWIEEKSIIKDLPQKNSLPCSYVDNSLEMQVPGLHNWEHSYATLGFVLWGSWTLRLHCTWAPFG